MFSRSAMAFGVLAAVELFVFLLAANRFGVLLLLVVGTALSVFGLVSFSRHPVGPVRRSAEQAAMASFHQLVPSFVRAQKSRQSILQQLHPSCADYV